MCEQYFCFLFRDILLYMIVLLKLFDERQATTQRESFKHHVQTAFWFCFCWIKYFQFFVLFRGGASPPSPSGDPPFFSNNFSNKTQTILGRACALQIFTPGTSSVQKSENPSSGGRGFKGGLPSSRRSFSKTIMYSGIYPRRSTKNFCLLAFGAFGAPAAAFGAFGVEKLFEKKGGLTEGAPPRPTNSILILSVE